MMWSKLTEPKNVFLAFRNLKITRRLLEFFENVPKLLQIFEFHIETGNGGNYLRLQKFLEYVVVA
jgi:hypothetical protein